MYGRTSKKIIRRFLSNLQIAKKWLIQAEPIEKIAAICTVLAFLGFGASSGVDNSTIQNNQNIIVNNYNQRNYISQDDSTSNEQKERERLYSFKNSEGETEKDEIRETDTIDEETEITQETELISQMERQTIDDSNMPYTLQLYVFLTIYLFQNIK